MPIKLKGYIELALAMFIAGSSVVVSKLLVQSLPVFLASECSLLIALLILIPLNFIIKKDMPKLDIKTLKILFLQAITGVFLFRVLLFLGLKFTSAAESGLITSTTPAMVGILAFFLLKEKLYLNRIIGIACVVAGILIINIYSSFTLHPGDINFIIGNALILLAVTCEAMFSVLSKKTHYPIPAMYRTTIITVFSVLCFIPFSIYDILHFNFSHLNYTTYLSVLYYGTFVSVVSYILWFKGISKVEASNAAVFSGIMPVSSIFVSCMILKEKILPSHIISLVLILLGIYFSCSNNSNLPILNKYAKRYRRGTS
ncbi:MAG TPA: DMT family transporter [Clostridia bacterium]